MRGLLQRLLRYIDESEESEEISAEDHYSLFSQINHFNYNDPPKNYKNDLKFALWGGISNSHPNVYDKNELHNEYSNNYQQISSEIDFQKHLKQIEIIDSLKPQFYFNAKNKSEFEKLRLQDSDQDSKESTSKTPFFIGTPTSGSQLGSLNGTGAVKAEDLNNAMRRINQASEIKKYVDFSSSNNSSWENLNKPHTLHFKPVMSFGGNENIDWLTGQSDMVVKEYDNDENTIEYDTFRV